MVGCVLREAHSGKLRLEMPDPDAGPDEDIVPWSDYIQRSTRIAETLMLKHDIPDVLHIQRRMVWRWATTVANHPTTRQTQRALV